MEELSEPDEISDSVQVDLAKRFRELCDEKPTVCVTLTELGDIGNRTFYSVGTDLGMDLLKEALKEVDADFEAVIRENLKGSKVFDALGGAFLDWSVDKLLKKGESLAPDDPIFHQTFEWLKNLKDTGNILEWFKDPRAKFNKTIGSHPVFDGLRRFSEFIRMTQ